MSRLPGARFLAGVLLLCAAAPMFAERIWLAGARADHACPLPAPPSGSFPCRPPVPRGPLTTACARACGGIRRRGARGHLRENRAAGLRAGRGPRIRRRSLPGERTDARGPEAPSRLCGQEALFGGPRRFSREEGPHQPRQPRRTPGAQVQRIARLLLEEELEPYLDAVAVPLDLVSSPSFDATLLSRPWSPASLPSPGEAVNAVLAALEKVPAAANVEVEGGLSQADWDALRRLQRYWTGNVSRDPTPTSAAAPTGRPWTFAVSSMQRLFRRFCSSRGIRPAPR